MPVTHKGRKIRYDDEQVELVHDSGYASADSFQVVAADFTPAAAVGTSTASDSAFIAAGMFNLLRSSGGFSKTNNYLAGVIGAFNGVGTISTTYPAAGVVAEVGDGVNSTSVNAVVASLGGDSATTIGNAAFKVINNNSLAASGFHYGMDLYNAAHSGYQATDTSFYLTADIRLPGQNIIKTGSGTPEGAVTAVVGSMFLRTNGGASTTLYIKESGSGNTGWVAK